jgi:hypothetical protein
VRRERDRMRPEHLENMRVILGGGGVIAYQPRQTEEWLFESATEFCAALDRLAERAMQIKRENHCTPFSALALRRAASR